MYNAPTEIQMECLRFIKEWRLVPYVVLQGLFRPSTLKGLEQRQLVKSFRYKIAKPDPGASDVVRIYLITKEGKKAIRLVQYD